MIQREVTARRHDGENLVEPADRLVFPGLRTAIQGLDRLLGGLQDGRWLLPTPPRAAIACLISDTHRDLERIEFTVAAAESRLDRRQVEPQPRRRGSWRRGGGGRPGRGVWGC